MPNYVNGHKVVIERIGEDKNNRVWVFEDTREPSTDRKRECSKCGLPPTEEGFDPCIGRLDGVKNACCGHGITDGVPHGYVMLEDGNIIRQEHPDHDIFSEFK